MSKRRQNWKHQDQARRWDATNRRKSEQLGMPHGTAMYRLRKAFTLSLLRRLGEDVCYRCGGKIESEDDLSFDHKEPWQDVDPKKFWDLENISPSHLACNVRHRRLVPRPVVCGTTTKYHYGCRCDLCKAAKSEANAAHRKLKKAVA